MERYFSDSDELPTIRDWTEPRGVPNTITGSPGRSRRRVSWAEYRTDARGSTAAARLKVYEYLLDLWLQGP